MNPAPFDTEALRRLFIPQNFSCLLIIAMKVHVPAFDGVFDTGLATALDTFATANELAAMVGLTSLRFDVRIGGVRETVRTSQGLSMLIVLAATIPHRS